MDEQTLRVTLPGKAYQQGDCWWWSVKLPGEDKAKPRPLKTQEAQAAVSDRESAEKIAFEMWEQAVREQAQSQIRAESSQKIAAFKAQFLDKIRQFTEIVESARAKAEAEARARTEAEARLRRFVETAEANTQDQQQKTQDEGRRAEPPPPQSPAQGPLVAAQWAISTPSAGGEIRHPPSEETGCCECCGAEAVPAQQLKQIDSGQLLCPHCLAALRTDAARSRPQPTARCIP